jgi:hypothetical protein
MEEIMTFQAYLDTVQKQTGMTADDFYALAGPRGYLDAGTKASTVTAWLKADYGLGHGHAMAVYKAITAVDAAPIAVDDQVAALFRGGRQTWLPAYETLRRRAGEFGPDVEVAVTSSYVSLLRAGRKFAIIAITEARMDIGLKLPSDESDVPFPAAGTWNSMVTHRVTIESPAPVDDEVIGWLRRAYAVR